MDCDIKITNIIEWIIAIFLGIIGWYVAIKSTLSQQKKERYYDLIQDFHTFIFNFRLFLHNSIKETNDKYIIQNISHQIKFIYFKSKDLDSFIKNKENKIYDKIKKAGEEFTDSALLDFDIENALISTDESEQVMVHKKNFLQFSDKFVEACYSITGFK
jgi:hypothetical protein